MTSNDCIPTKWNCLLEWTEAIVAQMTNESTKYNSFVRASTAIDDQIIMK